MGVRYTKAGQDLADDPQVLREMLDLGWEIANGAARLAPIRTGAGARSIRAELVVDEGGAEVRVSWDVDHFYLGFFELGTEEIDAVAMLRRAASEFS